MKKDTIYIDIEDDITSIIDKVKDSSSKIVALVPPKRSTALNSAVNMKLLKRAASEVGKKVVLVTSEASLLGLAGGVGMHVAGNLHSKPYLPKTEDAPFDEDVVIDGSELDPSAPVGELASVQAATEKAAPGKKPVKAAPGEKKKRFNFKIPSFERFRSRLLLIIAVVILLLVGWWWAFWLAPQATIAIEAQTSRIDTDFEFTADASIEESDFERNIFAAETVEINRTVTEEFEPTGTENVGEKASGTITVENCDTDESFIISEGTIFTANDLNFESLDDAAVPGASFSGGSCDTPGTVDVTTRAVNPGDQYNLAPTSYSIDGYGEFITGSGGQMSGGTTDEVTVVRQQDVNGARERLEENDRSDVLEELKTQVGEDMVSIDETYRVRLTDVTSQPAVGEEASNANLTATARFTVLAVDRETLTKAVEDFQQAAIDGGDQRIYDNGMDRLAFSLLERDGGQAEVRLRTEGYIGPEFDTERLAEDVSGKRYSEVVETVRSRPGVIDVEVDFSPWWVFSAPRAEKITINFDIQDSASQDQTEDETD